MGRACLLGRRNEVTVGEAGEGAEADEDVETGEGAEAAGLWAARLRGRLRSQGFKEACRSKLRKARRLGIP